jgi:hypothetical protein
MAFADRGRAGPRAPAKLRFVRICSMTTSRPGATRPCWPRQEPDPQGREFRHLAQTNVAEACLAILAGSRYHAIAADRRPRWVLAVRPHDGVRATFGVAGRRPEPANLVRVPLQRGRHLRQCSRPARRRATGDRRLPPADLRLGPQAHPPGKRLAGSAAARHPRRGARPRQRRRAVAGEDEAKVPPDGLLTMVAARRGDRWRFVSFSNVPTGKGRNARFLWRFLFRGSRPSVLGWSRHGGTCWRGSNGTWRNGPATATRRQPRSSARSAHLATSSRGRRPATHLRGWDGSSDNSPSSPRLRR